MLFRFPPSCPDQDQPPGKASQSPSWKKCFKTLTSKSSRFMILFSWMTRDSLQQEKTQLWFDILTPGLACTIPRFNWLSRAEIPWPTIRLCQERRQLATAPTPDIFGQSFALQIIAWKKNLKNYLLRSSRVSNSLASPLVPFFSPFFSDFSPSCPRSSFSESVSVTVLGRNGQSI